MSNVYHSLLGGNFTQDWSNAGLITTDGNWDLVPSIIGYRGDDITSATGINPQTLLGDGTVVVNVEANETNPNTFTTGGVAEFAITNPTIALQGSGIADAPHIVLFLNTTGVSNVIFSFNARDIDGSADNAIQPIAVQYRVGATGAWTNLPTAFVADATTGGTATQATAVSVILPTAAESQAQVQVRVITANAVGRDEWVGIDDISVTSTPGAAATVSIADAAVAEGNTGNTPLVFTLTRNDTTAAATIGYTVSFSGTAMRLTSLLP